MKEFKDRVAVVTGAASGIGLALAQRFAEEGMKVVLADVEEEPLARAEEALRRKGATTLAIRANVMNREEVERLADAAFSTFGNVHVLCNNAGVVALSAGAAIWDVPLDDWRWVMGVNFMGVVCGIHAFVPRMLANGEEGHIVNTASLAGLVTAPLGAYTASKHAVVAVTENLFKDLRARHSLLSASVLAPGLIRTNLMQAERNRPAELGEQIEFGQLSGSNREVVDSYVRGVSDGYPPEELAEQVCRAIREDRFYILVAADSAMAAIRFRFDDIVNLRNPTTAPVR